MHISLFCTPGLRTPSRGQSSSDSDASAGVERQPLESSAANASRRASKQVNRGRRRHRRVIVGVAVADFSVVVLWWWLYFVVFFSFVVVGIVVAVSVDGDVGVLLFSTFMDWYVCAPFCLSTRRQPSNTRNRSKRR